MLSFKPTFSLSSFTFIKRLFSSSISAMRVASSEVTDISPSNSSTHILQFSQSDLLTVPTVLGGVINKGTQKQERRAILGARLKGQVSKFGNYLALILSPERNSIFSTA